MTASSVSDVAAAKATPSHAARVAIATVMGASTNGWPATESTEASRCRVRRTETTLAFYPTELAGTPNAGAKLPEETETITQVSRMKSKLIPVSLRDLLGGSSKIALKLAFTAQPYHSTQSLL